MHGPTCIFWANLTPFSLGYTWMKYHLSPFFNVMDQMAAIQVAMVIVNW
jgi:hypothetical protein